MTTIQVSIEEPLLAKLDRAASDLAVTRADFVRDALEAALRKIEIKMLKQQREGYERNAVEPDEFGDWKVKALEQQDREGYERRPVTPEEFGDWEKVRDWGPE